MRTLCMTKGIAGPAFAAAVAASAFLSTATVAQQAGLVRVVADGKPWTMTQADGTTGQVTLTPDGKGQMQIGSRAVSPTWRQNEAGQLCVKPAAVVPERCATLSRDGQAIVGMNNGQVHFRLTRS